MKERFPWTGLVWTLVRTDFKARYHGTFGGFVWALAKPMAMFVVLVAIFSFIFASNPDYKLDLVVGLFLWDFFAEATKVGIGSLHAKSYLISRARFPTWILVLSSAANPLITLVVFAVMIVGFVTVYAAAPTPLGLALFGLYVLLYLTIVVGINLATSILYLRYRDLNQVWDLVLQAGFFVAPIIYPLEILPERFHFFLYVWPPTPVIQFCRAVLVDGTVPSPRAHLLLVGVAAVVLGFGVLVYRRLGPRAAELL